MARPRTYDESRPTTSLRLPAEVLARLDGEADRRMVSRNLLVEWAVKGWLAANEGVQLGPMVEYLSEPITGDGTGTVLPPFPRGDV